MLFCYVVLSKKNYPKTLIKLIENQKNQDEYSTIFLEVVSRSSSVFINISVNTFGVTNHVIIEMIKEENFKVLPIL